MKAKIWLAGALGALLVSHVASAQPLELNFGTVNDPGGNKNRNRIRRRQQKQSAGCAGQR